MVNRNNLIKNEKEIERIEELKKEKAKKKKKINVFLIA